MPGSAERSRKYGAKVIGDVSKSRLDHYVNRQKTAFTAAVGGQVHIERLVKSIISRNTVMVSLNHFYMNFGKKIDKIRRTYTGPTAQLEVCIEFEKWSSRGLDNTTLDEIVVALGFENCAAAPSVCAWSWKRKLTFSGNVSATNLDNFPVLVHLTVANFDFNKAHAQGHDIRFMDSDTCPSDGTPLKHEIELWDKAGSNAWVWVNVPRIDGGSVNDFIYMFYGNAGAADGQDVNGTWNANYTAVHHMLGGGALNMPDSTANANLALKKGIGEPVNFAAGQIDGSQDFDGVDDKVARDAAVGGLSADNHDRTISFWLHLNSYQAVTIFFYTLGKTGVLRKKYLVIYQPHTTPKRFYIDLHADGVIVNHTIPLTTWKHVTTVYTASTKSSEVFMDGVSIGGGAHAGNSQLITDALSIAAENPTTPVNHPDAVMDECRTQDVAESTDWIMASYRSGAELLITYGAEQPA